MRTRSVVVRVMRLLAASGLPFVAACDDVDHFVSSPPVVVHGDGDVLEQTRAISGVRSVNLQGVGILHIRQGIQEELVIRAEANLLEHLKTEVRSGELLIWKGAVTLFNTRPIEYHLTVVNLERVSFTGAGGIQGSDLDTGPLTLLLSGAGGVELLNLSAPRVDTVSSGVGNVILTGSVQQQTIELRGIGEYDGRYLESLEADILLTAIGSATVRVRDRLGVTIHGYGSVYYIGDPVIDSVISGSGELMKIGE